MDIRSLLEEGSQILKKNDISTYKLDCEILMSKAIKESREFVIMNQSKKVNFICSNFFKDLIKERAKGKPVAYILGMKDFWKYQFNLTEDVLIPRPETELIIENVLSLTKYKKKLNILDIGTGTGCILMSILKEKPKFYGVGIDVSKKCIDLSRTNATNLGLKNKVKFFKTDVDKFNHGKYDLIVSNPPYIKNIDLKYLEKDVINFEPILALSGGLEGLSEIRKVINKASELIKKNGKLVLEIAFDQKYKVINLLKDKKFYINKVLKDYSKNDRCIISTKI
tara:strand:- start:1085 stop:1927 length:843 start_codon:yes stop_codon:yes gene_type:complete